MTVNFVHESILKSWKIPLGSYLSYVRYCKWKFIRQLHVHVTCTMYMLMQTISVSPFSVSIHVAVEFPSTDTFVAAEVAFDVLGSVAGQDDGGHLVAGDQLLLRPRVVDPVGSPQVRLQMARQLGVGGEGLLTQLALEFLHVDKLDVVAQ